MQNNVNVLNTPNCMLKIGYDGIFVFCKFHHNFLSGVAASLDSGVALSPPSSSWLESSGAANPQTQFTETISGRLAAGGLYTPPWVLKADQPLSGWACGGSHICLPSKRPGQSGDCPPWSLRGGRKGGWALTLSEMKALLSAGMIGLVRFSDYFSSRAPVERGVCLVSAGDVGWLEPLSLLLERCGGSHPALEGVRDGGRYGGGQEVYVACPGQVAPSRKTDGSNFQSPWGRAELLSRKTTGAPCLPYQEAFRATRSECSSGLC